MVYVCLRLQRNIIRQTTRVTSCGGMSQHANCVQEAEHYIETIQNKTNTLSKHEQIRDLVVFAHQIMAGQNTESVSGVCKSNAVLNSILSTSENLQTLTKIAIQRSDQTDTAVSGCGNDKGDGQFLCAASAVQDSQYYKNSNNVNGNKASNNGNNGNSANNGGGDGGAGVNNEEIADIAWERMHETNIKYSDIVGCAEAIERIKESVVLPVKFPRLFDRLNAKRSHGIMLYGPPGTGKSMIARATASEVNACFFNASCADLTSRWVGGSEKKLQSLFKAALHNTPSIIFFDEVDSIACKREGDGSIADQRLTNQLLVELDKIHLYQSEVFVIAATNLPWQIDLAVMRRFPHMVYIPLPDMHNRKHMFRAAFDQESCSDENIAELAVLSENMSGSDISNIINNIQFDPVRTLCKSKHFLVSKLACLSPRTVDDTSSPVPHNNDTTHYDDGFTASISALSVHQALQFQHNNHNDHNDSPSPLHNTPQSLLVQEGHSSPPSAEYSCCVEETQKGPGRVLGVHTGPTTALPCAQVGPPSSDDHFLPGVTPLSSQLLLNTSLECIVSTHGEDCIVIPAIDFATIKKTISSSSHSVSLRYLQQYNEFHEQHK